MESGKNAKIKLSASGFDDMPAGLLSRHSYELADIVEHIVNCSVISCTVPSYWLNALVTPVPEVPKAAGFLISVLYLLPHSYVGLLKKIIVQRLILRSILPFVTLDMMMLRDQYAFKPTGSTTREHIGREAKLAIAASVTLTCLHTSAATRPGELSLTALT